MADAVVVQIISSIQQDLASYTKSLYKMRTFFDIFTRKDANMQVIRKCQFCWANKFDILLITGISF